MADTGGTSPGELGGMLAGALAILGAIGAALKWFMPWLAERADRRVASRAAGNREWEEKLRQREAEIDHRIAESLRSCEHHCERMRADVEKLRVAILLMLPELQRAAPYSPVLKRVGLLLRDAFPIPLDLPDDIAKPLGELGGSPGEPAPAQIWKDEI